MSFALSPTPTITLKTAGHFAKRAWIRDRTAPIGTPALGQINCPCHHAPLTNYTPGPDLVCNCGRIYTWDGWIISDQPTKE